MQVTQGYPAPGLPWLVPAVVLGVIGSSVAAEPGTVQLARPRVAVFAYGACGDRALREARNAVDEHLRTQLPAINLVYESWMSPQFNVTADQFQKSFANAKEDFLWLRLKSAETRFESLRPVVEHLPLEDRWRAYRGTWMYLARLAEQRGDPSKAEAFFREVLRFDEDFRASRQDFPPSTHEHLARTAQSLRDEPRFWFQVTTAKPGEGVLFNGRRVGVTPFKKEVLPGRYEVVLGDVGRHSIERVVSVEQDTSIEGIDVDWERRFWSRGWPCFELEARPTPEELTRALKTISRAVGATVVAVARRSHAGRDVVTASVYSPYPPGERIVREGAMCAEPGQSPDLAQLAEYVGGACTSHGLARSAAQEGAASRAEAAVLTPGCVLPGWPTPRTTAPPPRPSAPSAPPVQTQIAIYPFDAEGVPTAVMERVGAALSAELARVLGAVVSAPSTTPGKRCGLDVGCLVQFGKDAAAREVVYGKVKTIAGCYSVSVRLLSVGAGKATEGATEVVKATEEELTRIAKAGVFRLLAPEAYVGRLRVDAPPSALVTLDGIEVDPSMKSWQAMEPELETTCLATAPTTIR